MNTTTTTEVMIEATADSIRIKELEEERDDLETKVSELEDERDELETKVSELEDERDELETKVSELETKESLLEYEVEQLKDEVEQLKDELKQLKAQTKPIKPMMVTVNSEAELDSQILHLLKTTPGSTVKALAKSLGLDKKAINSKLYKMNNKTIVQMGLDGTAPKWAVL
jgi:uncharacterized coiled-coil DUF342 family protein